MIPLQNFSRLLLPVFSSFLGLVAPCCFLLMAHGVQAQNYFGKQYITGWCSDNFAVRGPGTDFWMMRQMFDSDVIFSRLDSTGEPLATYHPVLPNGYEIEGQDLIYSPQDQRITSVGYSGGTGTLLQLNDSGAITFMNAIQAPLGRIYLFGVDSCTPTSFIASGGYRKDTGVVVNDDGILARFRSQDGGLICTTSFGGLGDEWAYDVAKVPGQNQVIAVGHTTSFGAVGFGAYIMAVDTNCNKLWSLMLDGAGEDAATKVLIDGSGIMVFGHTRSFLPNRQWFVARIALNGTLQGFWTIDIDGQHSSMVNALVLPDGGYIIVGYDLYTGIMVRLDSAMAIQWSHWMGDVEDFHSQSLMMNDAATALYLWSTTEADGSSQNDAMMYRMGMDGTLGAWCIVSPISSISIQPASISSQYVTGDQLPVTLVNNFVQGTTVMESLSWVDACSTYVGTPPVTEESEMTISPNPTLDVVKVQLARPLPMRGSMQLYDVHGRLLQRKDVAAGAAELEMDLSGFPAGMYVMELSSGILHWSAKLVKSGW